MNNCNQIDGAKRKYKPKTLNTKTKKKEHTKNTPTKKKQTTKKRYCKGGNCEGVLLEGKQQKCKKCKKAKEYSNKKAKAKKLGKCLTKNCDGKIDKNSSMVHCESCREKRRKKYKETKSKKSCTSITRDKAIRRLQSAIGARVVQILLEKQELITKYGPISQRHETKFSDANDDNYDLDHVEPLITSDSIDQMISRNNSKNLVYRLKGDNRGDKNYLTNTMYKDFRYVVNNLKPYQRQILKNVFDVEILFNAIEITEFEYKEEESKSFFIALIVDGLTIDCIDDLKLIISHLEDILHQRQRQMRRKRRT